MELVIKDMSDSDTPEHTLPQVKPSGSMDGIKTEDLEALETTEMTAVQIELYKMSEPMALTNSYLKRPGTWLTVFFLLAISASVACIFLGFFEVDKLRDRDYFIIDDMKVREYNMQKLMHENLDLAKESLRQQSRSKLAKEWQTVLVFKNEVDEENGLMSRDNLIKMQSLEKWIQSHPVWNETCLAPQEKGIRCSPLAVVSPLTMLQMAGLEVQNLANKSQSDINSYFNKALKTE